MISLPNNFESQTTILLYQSGLSGEFLGWSFSECLSDFSVGENYKEDQGRYKYIDALGRTLMGGGDIPSQEKINERINNYQQNQIRSGSKQLILAHPDLAYIDFIKQHFLKSPVIEITSRHYTSQIFQFLSRNVKITEKDLEDSVYNHKKELTIREHFTRYQSPNHLEIEWSDLVLNCTQKSVESIAEFLNCKFDYQKFSAMLNDYKQQNRELISRCTF